MKEFKIRFHSGLGDCFRMLTQQPSIHLFNETTGLKIHWVYDRSGAVQNLPTQRYTNYPLQFVMQEILQNVDFFNPVSYDEYVSLQVTELDNWKLENTVVDQLQGIFPTESPGFDIPMSLNEKSQLETLLSKKGSSICVQLTGKDERKNYSSSNYRKLFELILHTYPHTKILLIDHPDKKVDSSLLFDNRIFDLTSKFTIVQQINLIRRADYLIAPDSYSKYIRRWSNGRQSILCTSLDYISNRGLLLGCFGDYQQPYTAGLLFNPDVKLLGVKYTENLDDLEIVDNINNITPNDVFDSIKLKA